MSYYNPYQVFHGAFTPNWLMRRKEVSPGAKLCLVRLYQYCGENGRCYPKLETLAEELGVTKRTVCRYLDELETHGLIERVRRMRGKQGGYKSTEYLFPNHQWVEFKFDPNRDVTDTAQRDVTDMTQRDVTDMTHEVGSKVFEENQKSLKREHTTLDSNNTSTVPYKNVAGSLSPDTDLTELDKSKPSGRFVLHYINTYRPMAGNPLATMPIGDREGVWLQVQALIDRHGEELAIETFDKIKHRAPASIKQSILYINQELEKVAPVRRDGGDAKRERDEQTARLIAMHDGPNAQTVDDKEGASLFEQIGFNPKK